MRRLHPQGADDAAIEALIIGPSGNLRAPAFFTGNRLIIGFEEETYREVLTSEAS